MSGLFWWTGAIIWAGVGGLIAGLVLRILLGG